MLKLEQKFSVVTLTPRKNLLFELITRRSKAQTLFILLF